VALSTAAALAACAAAGQPALAASGTWTGAAGDGLWSTNGPPTSNWTASIIADGATFTADFSTQNITSDQTVHLDTARTIGLLKFNDATTQSNNWTLDNNGVSTNILTLDNGTSQPTLTIGGTAGNITGQVTQISTVLAGTNGFFKTGSGALQLNAANTFTGQITLSSTYTVTTAPATSTTPDADLILNNNAALGNSSNLLFIDPTASGVAGVARVRAAAGTVIPNPIEIRSPRAPLGNGVLQPFGAVSATYSGPITIDSMVGSGGVFSGPNDTSLANFLTISGAVTLSTWNGSFGYVNNPSHPEWMNNANNNGVTIRTGNVLFTNTNSNYFRLEIRTGEARIGATNAIATNAYVDMGVNSANPNTSINATLDLFGFNQTLRGISDVDDPNTNGQPVNGATVTNSSTTPSTLTLTPGVLSTGETTAPSLLFTAGASGTGTNVAITDNATNGGVLNLIINGTATGQQTFNTSASSYHGTTTLSSGILSVNTLNNGGSNSSIGASTNAASNLVFGGGTLQYTGPTVTTDRSFTINNSATAVINVSQATTTLTVNSGTGGGGLNKIGAGTLVMSGASDYTGDTAVTTGTLLVNGSITSANTNVLAGTTLGGSGSISGTVTTTGSNFIAPGPASSVGTLAVGGLTVNTGSTLFFDFGSSSNDAITVNNAGGLALNGGTLEVVQAGSSTSNPTFFAGPNGTTMYTLMNINGGFSGSLSNIAVVGVPYKNYALSSTANSIVLTITDGIIRDWSNGNATTNWTETGNWSGGVVPNASTETARFSTANLVGTDGTVHLDASQTVNNLLFDNTSNPSVSFNLSTTNASVLSMNSASGSTAITILNGQHTVSVPISLGAAFSVTTTNPTDALTLSGNITGSKPLTTFGPGTVTLSGTNALTTVAVNSGTLNVGAGGATGTLGTGAVTLSGGAILNFNLSSAYSFGQPIDGAGTVNQLGSNTVTVGAIGSTTPVNSVTVSSGALNTGSIAQTGGINVVGPSNVTGTGSMTTSGGISGAGKLTVNTTGTVTIGGSSSYSGGTELDAGKIVLNAAGAFPANTALAVNGGTFDLNARSISINNILDLPTSTGVITNNGASSTTATVTFTGNAANYNMYAGLNNGTNGGKVALVSTINNVNAGAFRLNMHTAGTYSGGTTITRQSIEALVTNALGTGPITIQTNNASVNVTSLFVAGGVTLPNNITIQQGNPGTQGIGAIQYDGAVTTGDATLNGSVTVQADPTSGGTFGGPTVAGTLLHVNGQVNTTGTATNISVRVGNVTFAGGGSYPMLNVYSNAFVSATNGIATSAIINTSPDVNNPGSGKLDISGNNQTVAGLIGGGGVTNSAVTAATLTVNNSTNLSFPGTIIGNLNLVKSGAGTQALGGTNSYTGTTVIHAGTLRLNGAGVPQPIANYTFDSGDVNNHGTGGAAMNGGVSGSVDFSQPGVFGGSSATFDGTGNSINVASGITDLSGGGHWSVAAWVKTNVDGSAIFTKNSAGTYVAGSSVFYLTNPTAAGSGPVAGAIRNGTPSTLIKGSTSIDDNTWHFVTYIDNGGTKQIYVDGVPETMNATDFGGADTGNLVQIGTSVDNNGADGTFPMTGSIDEMKFYGTNLTASQVHDLFVANAIAPNNIAPILPVTTAVNIDTSGGTLDLNGNFQTIASLTGVAGTSVTLGTATLTTGDSTSTTFAGAISGAGGLTKQGSGTFTLSGANTYSGNTNVAAGTLTIDTAGSTAGTNYSVAPTATLNVNGVIPAASSVNVSGTANFAGSASTAAASRTIGALTVNNGATASITGSPSSFTPMTLTVTSPLAITGTGKIDVTNNILVAPGVPTDARSLITSNAVVTTNTHGLALGYGVGPGTGNFEIRATLLGDSDLDGLVNVADLANLAGNFGVTTGMLWINGDFDYNQNVNVADLADLAGNFGSQLNSSGGAGTAAAGAVGAAAPAGVAIAAGAAVPEPTGVGLLIFAASASAAIGGGRRRRRRAINEIPSAAAAARA
jgi:autotransporter-associated beta strand protein